MMGYAMAMSPCICCNRVFSYNPVKVPSTSAITGTREPICRECLALINKKRKEKGLLLIQADPQAYEPLPEEELP